MKQAMRKFLTKKSDYHGEFHVAAEK